MMVAMLGAKGVKTEVQEHAVDARTHHQKMTWPGEFGVCEVWLGELNFTATRRAGQIKNTKTSVGLTLPLHLLHRLRQSGCRFHIDEFIV
jgi:hypothetical protein